MTVGLPRIAPSEGANNSHPTASVIPQESQCLTPVNFLVVDWVSALKQDSTRAYHILESTAKWRKANLSERTPRPRNPFMVFRSFYCVALKELSATFPFVNPNEKQSIVSAEASRLWKSLPLHLVGFFERLAHCEKSEHQKKFPSYKFKLGRPRRMANGTDFAAAAPTHKPESAVNATAGAALSPPSATSLLSPRFPSPSASSSGSVPDSPITASTNSPETVSTPLNHSGPLDFEAAILQNLTLSFGLLHPPSPLPIQTVSPTYYPPTDTLGVLPLDFWSTLPPVPVPSEELQYPPPPLPMETLLSQRQPQQVSQDVIPSPFKNGSKPDDIFLPTTPSSSYSYSFFNDQYTGLM